MAPKRSVPRAEGGKSTLLRYASPRRTRDGRFEEESETKDEGKSPSTRLMPPPPPRRPTTKEIATTLYEAQETGERNQFEDDVFYLLAGAETTKPTVQRGSLGKMVTLCSSNKAGRMLRATGTLERVVSCACRNETEDPIISLQVAALLFALSRDAANVPKLEGKQLVNCLLHLLRQPVRGPSIDDLPDKSNKSALTHIENMFQEGGELWGTLAHEENEDRVKVSAPLLAAHVLEACTRSPESESALIAVDKFKEQFCELGGVQGLAFASEILVNELRDGIPEQKPLHVLECLMVNLRILENITFLSDVNVTTLLDLQLSSDGGDETGSHRFFMEACISWLELLSSRMPGRCIMYVLALKSVLALLVNISNGNEEGCRQIPKCGGLNAISAALVGLLTPALVSEEVSDTINMALCLLINLVEKDEVNRRQLVGVVVNGESMVLHLCRLVGSSGPPHSDYESDDEVTEEMLQKNEKDGIRAMVQTYTALLLSFLLLGNEEVRQEVDAHLEGGVSSLPSILERLKQFHLSTQSMTKENMSTITALIQALKGQELA